jgi:cytoskeleton protein RodZ
MDAADAEQRRGGGPGPRLRAAREAQGWTTARVAEELHLDAALVEALEQDAYDRLPQPAYVRGYLRAAARLLGLEESDLLDGYERSRPQTPEPTPRPQIARRKERPSGALWLIVAAAAFAVVAWVLWWPESEAPSPTVTVEPPSLEAPAEAPAPAPEPLFLPPSEPAETLVEPAETLTEPVESLAAEPESAAIAGPAAEPAAPAATPEPVVVPATGEDLLRMRFVAPSWVEVTDANQARLLYGLIREGRTELLRGQAPFRVRLGNAPGVELEINGSPVDIAPRIRADNTARLTLE